MSNRKNPQTSFDAHDSIKDSKSYYYKKIIEGLTKLQVGGHFEEIAEASGVKPSQVWKRLSEMIDMGILFNTGVTRKTSSGRQAMVRQLTNISPRQIPTQTPDTIIHNATKPAYKQLDLL